MILMNDLVKLQDGNIIIRNIICTLNSGHEIE